MGSRRGPSAPANGSLRPLAGQTDPGYKLLPETMPRQRSSSSRALLAAAVFGLASLAPGLTDLHEAWGASTPQPTKGPYLTDLADTRVEIRFELGSAAPASVTLQAQGDPGPARTIDDPSNAMHVVRASSLKAATTYAYTVRVGGAAAGGGQFTTAPSPTSGAPTTFLVYGDSRSDPTTHAAMTREMAATPADFLVNTGDVVAEGGRAADWQRSSRSRGRCCSDRALFLCIGNHELYDDEAGANFARYFGFRAPQEAGGVRTCTLRHGAVERSPLLLPQWDARLARGRRAEVARARTGRAQTTRPVWCGASPSFTTGPGRAALTEATQSCCRHAFRSCWPRTTWTWCCPATTTSTSGGRWGRRSISSRAAAERRSIRSRSGRLVGEGRVGLPLHRGHGFVRHASCSRSHDRRHGPRRLRLPQGSGVGVRQACPDGGRAVSARPRPHRPDAHAPRRGPRPLRGRWLWSACWRRPARPWCFDGGVDRPACRPLRSRAMRLSMQAAALGLLSLSVLASAGCTTYQDDLARGQRAFEESEHERALAIFRSLEPDTGRLTIPSEPTTPTCAA